MNDRSSIDDSCRAFFLPLRELAIEADQAPTAEMRGRAIRAITSQEREIIDTIDQIGQNRMGVLNEPILDFVSHLSSLRKKDISPEEGVALERIQTAYETVMDRHQDQKVEDTSAFVQLQVSQQRQDADDFENCGYHALKNAIILSGLSQDREGTLAALQDPHVFGAFYSRYCEPLLVGLPRGTRDASAVLVRQMITDFCADPSPPLELEEAQAHFKSTNVAVLSTFPETGLSALNVRFGLVDRADLRDAVRLYEFATSPGPGVFTCPVGDSVTGHWYTVCAQKDSEGTFTVSGADSLGIVHTGASPLSQIGQLFQDALGQPDAFLGRRLEEFADELAASGGQLTVEGAPRDESALRMIATDAESVEVLVLASEAMHRLDWVNSPDLSKISSVENIHKILRFYANQLSHDSEEYPIVSAALDRLDGAHTFGVPLLHMLEQMQRDADQMPTGRERQVFSNTIVSMREVYESRRAISQEADQASREGKAQEISRAGVEAGFIAGRTSEEATESIITKTQILVMAYQTACKLNKKNEFFTTLARGDPCLTARMGRLEEFLGRLQSVGDFTEDLRTEHIYTLSDVAISEYLALACRDLDEVAAFQPEHFDVQELGELFASFSKGEKAEALKAFLVREGFVEKEQIKSIDWPTVVKKLVASDFFPTMLIRGKSLARMSF